MIVTIFPNVSALNKEQTDLTTDELAALIRKTKAAEKARLPLLKCAVFGENRTKAGSLRHNDNVLAISGIEGDYDTGELPMETAAELIRQAELEAVLYTSARHTPEAPRWRVLCPFSGGLPPDARDHMLDRLNGVLGGVLSGESWTLSQSFYFGAVNDGYRVLRIEGRPIDLADDLDASAIGKRPDDKTEEQRARGNGHDPEPAEFTTGRGRPIPLERLPLTVVELITRATINGETVKKRGPAFMKVVRALRRAGYEFEDVLATLQTHPDGVQAKFAGRLEKQLRDVWGKLDDAAALLADFNRKYAVVNEAGKAWVFEQKHDPTLNRNVLVRASFADFKKFYLNRYIEQAPLADFWLEHEDRRQYLDGVTFDPTNRAPRTMWNLWTGFSVEPQPGDWILMYSHILDVICSGNVAHAEYLLDLIARMFQYPNKQAEVAVVFRGKKGTGKGVLCTMLVRAWGQHGLHITNAKHLIGNFNQHLRDCVCLFADEGFFAGDREHESVLKGLITEPTMPIEGKYQNVVTVPNMLHVFMASNSDWVIPASSDERRYYVLDVADAHLGDRPYFNALYAQMENGGLAAMIHDMLVRDISEFDHRAVPTTDALITQKKHSLDSLDRWWLAVLERGFVWRSRHGCPEFAKWMEWCSTELLNRSYLQWCADNRVTRPQSRISLGIRLTQIYGEGKRASADEIIGEVDNPDKYGTAIAKMQRPHGYLLGSVDAACNAFTNTRGVAPDKADE